MIKDNKQKFLDLVEKSWPVAKGSIALVHKPCTNKNCQVCKSGKRHPSFILEYMEEGKRKCMHVPKEMVEVLKKAIENGRLLEKELLKMGKEMILDYRHKRDKVKESN
jgi:hypothetical protein